MFNRRKRTRPIPYRPRPYQGERPFRLVSTAQSEFACRSWTGGAAMTVRLTDRLSPPARNSVESIVGVAFTVIGTARPIQAIVDLALPHFEDLLLGGLAPQEICTLLSEHGLAGNSDAAIPKSSLTSALSRARSKVTERSAASCGGGRQVAAISCTQMQTAASHLITPLDAAYGCNALQSASLYTEPLRTAESPLEPLGHPHGGPGPPLHRNTDRMSPTRQRAFALRTIQDTERSYDQD